MKPMRLIPDDLGFILDKPDKLNKLKYLPNSTGLSVQNSVDHDSKLYRSLRSLAKHSEVICSCTILDER